MPFCPSCGTPVEGDVDACAECGFSVPEIERIFGPVPRHRAVVNDPNGALSAKEDNALHTLQRRIRSKFPQVFPACYLGKMPERAHALAYGTWLINRCRFADGEPKLGENFSILLFIDPFAGQASLVAGYGLETILSLDQIGSILDDVEPMLRRAQWFGAIRSVWQGLFKSLAHAQRAMG